MALEGQPEVLVLRALGLGDLLTGLPALRALRRAFPGHRLVVAMPGHLGALARHAGVADEVLDHSGTAPLGLRPEPPWLAVNLHGRGPASHRALLRTGPRRMICFRHPAVAESRGQALWAAGEHEVLRWCRLLGDSGILADPARLELEAPGGWAAEAAAGATIVHPGAASAARRWPARRWAGVARAEAAAGRRVLVTGARADAALAAEVASMAGLGPASVLAGRTDLVELAAAVGAAGRLVSGDTGVAHLATALGTPSVVLFGPVPPSEWGPPAGLPGHRALWAGRRGDPHGREVDPGLLSLQVSDVLGALETLPGR